VVKAKRCHIWSTRQSYANRNTPTDKPHLQLWEHYSRCVLLCRSEVEAQVKQIPQSSEGVPIPAKCNYEAIYAAAEVKGAPHPQAAKDWLQFLKSPAALKVFEFYGFKPYEGER
jgi:ABC-type molybdate transport system, periplasmic component